MGIEEEADRTLFVRNLDSRVTEELLFELFVQAGPLIRTKIPKDPDGKQKTFGFAVYKHEVSAPYAVQLLNGTSLFGRTLHVQFRSGSSHNSPGHSQSSSPVHTPNPHGQRNPAQFSSPPYTPPQMQRSFSSPENLQKSAMMNNMMWQLHGMQHADQPNGSFSKNPQRQSSGGGGGGSGSRHHNAAPYSPYPASHMNSGGRNQRYNDEQSPGGRDGQHGHGRDGYHHQQKERSGGGRHHDGRGGSRHHDDRSRGYQDNRWNRRY
ncbi:RNA-binding protein 7 [Nelusetta ayraudi]|uniref:RNA-binding protein 7 n=1 Tax=Nelusetta ayraudi TaxID=303726 RepID=UPI003F6F3287